MKDFDQYPPICPEPVEEQKKATRGLFIDDSKFPTWFALMPKNGTRSIVNFEVKTVSRGRAPKYKTRVIDKPTDNNLPQGLEVRPAYEALKKRYGLNTNWYALVPGRLARGGNNRLCSFPRHKKRDGKRRITDKRKIANIQNIRR